MLYQGIPRFLCASFLVASLLLAFALLLVDFSRAENALAPALPPGMTSPHNVSLAREGSAPFYFSTACPYPDARRPALSPSDQEATRLAALAKSEAFDSVASAHASPTHLTSRSRLLAQLTGGSFPAREALGALGSPSDLTPILRC